MSVSSFDEWLIWNDDFRGLPDDLRSKIVDHIRRQDTENYQLLQRVFPTECEHKDLINRVDSCLNLLGTANTRQSAIDWMACAYQLLKQIRKELSRG